MGKGPFDYWNENAKLEYEKDDVRVYFMDGEQYLFVGQIMYASTTERSWYIKQVMPRAQGKCLEIGLGLGVASKVILARPDVQHLLTIEKSEAVIAAFGQPLPRHNILWGDVHEWIDNFYDPTPMYDLIFVDHYTDMDDLLYEELRILVGKLVYLLKPNGKLIVWIDENLSPEEIEDFKKFWVV